MPTAEILTAARAWLAQDPDPDTRAELQALIDAESDELAERFCGPLAFGTAGLRGILGAGESRMNRAVVRRTSAGLARYLLEHQPDVRERGVVVGYDGRHNSDVFARDTAAVLCAAEIPVFLSEGVCPTPIVAYAVKELEAAAGVMVTASHNPPRYNGYKVYAQNGAQIIPPADSHIAGAIAKIGPANEVATLEPQLARERGLLKGIGDDLQGRYLNAIGKMVGDGGDRSLPIAYTPLHGVGAKLVKQAMKAAGFEQLHIVAEQAEPDGAFPTVDFPNPEEAGAMDLVLALAAEHDAPLVIANDPDADRLAAAVRTSAGRYVQLTGNELGVMLGHYALTNDSGQDGLVVATVVSSPMLGVIARELGVAYEETLTGFKWITNRAMELERNDGKRFLFGYEEALGYTVGSLVRDKDGISAALVLAVHAAELHARGETLLDELTRISRRFGLFASSQIALKFPGSRGKAKMEAIMAALRNEPPDAIGNHDVLAVTDCLLGERRAAGAEPTAIALPKSNVLVYELDGGHRVIARPSGTEPKIKLYFDVREQLSAEETLEAGKARAAEHIAELSADFQRRVEAPAD